MKVESLFDNYKHFFDDKISTSASFQDKMGWRALQITTGIVCYPILGLVSGIAASINKLSSLLFSKKAEQNESNSTSLSADYQIQEASQRKLLEDLKHRLSNELLKLTSHSLLNDKELNEELESLKKIQEDIEKIETPLDKNTQSLIQQVKNQINIRKLKNEFSTETGLIKNLDEEELAQKITYLKESKTKLSQLGDFESQLNTWINHLENHLKFIREVRQAHEKKLIDLGENPQDKISELRQDEKLMERYEKVQTYRTEKAENKELKSDPEHVLKRSVAKAKFAYQLGVKPTFPGAGVHATYFMRSTTGKTLGVFKESDLRVSVMRGLWRNFSARIGIGQEHILNKGKYVQIAGEKAAYIIKQKMEKKAGHKFDFDLAPVKVSSFSNLSSEESGKKKGAFLVFCKNVNLANEVISSVNKTSFEKDEVVRCHLAFLYDFLLGNLDRHTKNYMIGISEDKISKVLLIDNSNILPVEDPKFHNITANKARFAWKKLNIAQLEIPQEVKDIYLKLLEDPAKFVEDLFEDDDGINKNPEIEKLLELDRTENPELFDSSSDELKYFSDESKENMKKGQFFLKML